MSGSVRKKKKAGQESTNSFGKRNNSKQNVREHFEFVHLQTSYTR